MAILFSNQDDLSDDALSALDKSPTHSPPPRPPVACHRCTELRLRCEGGAPCGPCTLCDEQCTLDMSVMNWSYDDMADPVSLWPESWQVAFDELLKATTTPGELQEVADVINDLPHSYDAAAGVVDPSRLTLQPQEFGTTAIPPAKNIITATAQQLPSSNTDPNLGPKTQAYDSGLASAQGPSWWPRKRKRGPLTPPEEETPWIYDDPEELHPATNQPALRPEDAERLSSLFPTTQLLESLSRNPNSYVPPGVEDSLTPKPQPPPTFQSDMGRVMSLPDQSAPQFLVPPLGNPPEKFHQPPFVRPPFQQENPLRANDSTSEPGRSPQLGQESTFTPNAAVSFQKQGPPSLTDKVNARIRGCSSSTQTAAEALRLEETTAEQLGLGGRYIAVHLPRTIGQHLLYLYFEYSLPTLRFLYQPQVQQWFHEFYFGGGELRCRQNDRNKVAIVLLVLALGILQIPEKERPGGPGLDEQLYLSALREAQLAKSYPPSIEGVQAHFLRCLYLFERRRINHCAEIFKNVAAKTTEISLQSDKDWNNQNWGGEIEKPDPVHTQGRRRTYWCIFIMDVLLSIILEKPLCLPEHYTTPLPACINDENIQKSDRVGLTISATDEFPMELFRKPSIMFPVIAHIKLSLILAEEIHLNHRDKPCDANIRRAANEKTHKWLRFWLVWVSRWAKTGEPVKQHNFPLIYRQLNVLKLSYSQAIIYLSRPAIMDNILNTIQVVSGEEDIYQDSFDRCMKAAMTTVLAIQAMDNDPLTEGKHPVTPYAAFTAAMVLYFAVLQKEGPPSKPERLSLEAAGLCRRHISLIADEGTLLERYCNMLDEIRINAFKALGGYLSSSVASSEKPTRGSKSFQAHKKWRTLNTLLADAKGEERERRMKLALVEGRSQWTDLMKQVWSETGNMQAFLDYERKCK